MRKSYHDNGLIVINDKFIGVSLGYDFCAEHEWGIDGIKFKFGIPANTKANMGISCRTITKCPKLTFREGNDNGIKHGILFITVPWHNEKENEEYIPNCFGDYVHSIKSEIDRIASRNKEISKRNKKIMNSENKERLLEEKDPIVTAWCDDNFSVAVYGNKETEYLKELYDAFQNNNIAILYASIQPQNQFANSVLCLLIADRIPIETAESVYLADRKAYDLQDYEESIGMEEIIKKYGNKNGYNGAKYFLACSPKWIDYEDTKAREEQKTKWNTKYNIMYWVNHSDNDNNFGWYTVEEIREWMTTDKKLIDIRK